MSKLVFSNIQQRPYKVWSADRTIRKSISAANLAELKSRAAERLGYTTTPTSTIARSSSSSRFRLVFEEDGTEVEDEAVFQSTAKAETVFLLLRENESWAATCKDALKSALAAIPQIVCDTINSMALANKAPTWSIKDDQGFITVILQWEHDQQDKTLAYGLDDYDEASWSISRIAAPPSYAQLSSPSSTSAEKVYSSTFPRSRMRSQSASTRRPATFWPPSATTFPVPPYKTLSADDFSLLGDHRLAGLGSTSATLGADDLTSSAHDLPSQATSLSLFCDFHCSSLHREGGSIRVSQSGGSVTSVGTSPIPELLLGGGVGGGIRTTSRTTSPLIPPVTTSAAAFASPHRSTGSSFTTSTMIQPPHPLLEAQHLGDQQQQMSSFQIAQQILPAKAKKAGVHVRFLDLDNGTNGEKGGGSRSQQQQSSSNISLLGQLLNGHQTSQKSQTLQERTPSSEESETETTEREEEQLRERYLLLVDSQLEGGGVCRHQSRHPHSHHHQSRRLSIKDIGVILERLRYKIVDVDRLEREKETGGSTSSSSSISSYNWLLRATIRGEMLREIGVVYNGQYYGLMEHPAYY